MKNYALYFDELSVSNYPLDLILNHMSMIDRLTILSFVSYLIENQELAGEFGKKLRLIFMSFMDLLEEFLDAFQALHFAYDLWITTDVEEKKQLLSKFFLIGHKMRRLVTGNIGRDVANALKKSNFLNMIM